MLTELIISFDDADDNALRVKRDMQLMTEIGNQGWSNRFS